MNMLRMIVRVSVARCIGSSGMSRTVNFTPNIAVPQIKRYTTLSQFSLLQSWPVKCNTLLSCVSKPQILSEFLTQPKIQSLQQPHIRTLTKFSIRKGKRKTVKAVKKRFFRLAWGAWIRTRAGRFKHLWRKSENLKYRYRQHIFCNATQCHLLDKMVTKYWKRRRYYVDDPYEPYHSREEYMYSRKKPLPAPPR